MRRSRRFIAWLVVIVGFLAVRSKLSTPKDTPKKPSLVPRRPAQREVPPRNPAPAEKWRVSADGIGPVKVGMSAADAAAALGEYFAISGIAGQTGRFCDYAEWPGAPEGVNVVLRSDTVASVWVRDGGVMTEDYIKIGDKMDVIERRYPGSPIKKVANDAHYYGKAWSIEVPAPGDPSRSLIYEVSDSTIRSFRGGKELSPYNREPCR